MVGIILQSSLDDVYKDLGRVTDNLRSKLSSLKKNYVEVKSKVDFLGDSCAKKTDIHEN